MDPLQSWLDAKAVRQMAESLMAPVPEVDESAVNAGYGDTFEGFAGNAPGAARRPDNPVTDVESGHASPGQKQFTNQSAASMKTGDLLADPRNGDETVPAANVADEARRAVIENSLADAKRLAEDSGMLGHESLADQSVSADHTEEVPDDTSPANSISETAESHPVSGGYDSPFKISEDQVHSDDDPVALPGHAGQGGSDLQARSNEVTGEEADEQLAAELPPIEGQSKSFFRPAIHVAQDALAADTAAEPDDLAEPEPDSQVAESPQTDVARPAGAMQPDPQYSGEDTVQAGVRGPFLARLQQFSGIIRRDLGAKAMFLIDNEGQTLLDEVENAKLIQVARTLANASYRASRQTAGAAAIGNLHVKISANATLEVVPVESRYGLLILGVIFPAPIGAARVIQLAEELFRTVEPSHQ